ncbi:MAG: metallophosphoesterase [Sedimentisphaerales bacterium]|nr:metallophosphoesterase [Sedimentisphaerales bacterium]
MEKNKKMTIILTALLLWIISGIAPGAVGDNFYMSEYSGSEPDTLLLYHFNEPDQAASIPAGYNINPSAFTGGDGFTANGWSGGGYLSTFAGNGAIVSGTSAASLFSASDPVKTIEAWVKIAPSAFDGSGNFDTPWNEMQLARFDGASGAGGAGGLIINTNNGTNEGTLQSTFGYGLGGTSDSSSVTWEAATWYHLAWEFRNSDQNEPGVKFYRNDELIGYVEQDIDWSDSGDIYWANHPAGSPVDAGLEGVMDEFRVSNTAFNPVSAPVAQITESGSNTLVMEEGPTTDDFTVQLLSQPNNDIYVTIDPDEDIHLEGKGAGEPNTLTFTNANWDTEQTVTIWAVDDTQPEPSEEISIITFQVTASNPTSDPDFEGGYVPLLQVSVMDNDTVTVEIEKGPYLIYPDDNTKMTVLWRLNATRTCMLEWGEDNGRVPVYTHSVQTSEYGADHQHKYTIPNLKLGFNYDYRVTVDTNQYLGSFRAAPPDYAYNVKFFAYGDTRTYPADHALVTTRMVETFTNDPNYQTFTIHVGDFVTNADLESNWTDEFFNRNYPATLQCQANLPLQGCMGNHEYTGVGFSKYWPYPFVDANNGYYWSFDYGPAHVAILDQFSYGGWSAAEHGFMLGTQQLAWLENDLATSDKQWKFVAFHVPGWSAGHPSVLLDDPDGEVNDRIIQNYVQPLCKTYGVDMIFAGDLHYYARCEVSGVEHITTGGGGAPLHDPTVDPENLPPYLEVGPISTHEFCKIDIQGNKLNFEAIKASDGSLLDSFTIVHALAGDVDDNGCVDLFDYSAFFLQWLEINCPTYEWCYGADVDRSGEVDTVDLKMLTDNWLNCHVLTDSNSIFITEFMAVNDSTTKDEDGDLTGWIEIFNASAEPFNLYHWYLTDDPENLTKWQFPKAEIPSEGFEVVFASGKNRATAGAELHTNFLLAAEGGYLALVKPDGATITTEYAPYSAQTTDVSYGRLMDDATVTSQNDFFQVPTPGALNAGSPFTLIILPDTQIYSCNDPAWRNSSLLEVYIQMTSWIVNNVAPLNIKFVLHMGDIVQNNGTPQEWTNADAAMSQLDGVVPYSFVVGNHDMVLDATRDTTNFNNTFPYTRYESKSWYGGRLANDGYAPFDSYDNAYHFFHASGMDFLVVTLEAGPTDDMLDWANNVIGNHPECRVIVTTHSYMLGNDTRDATCSYLPPCPPGNTGEQVWNKLVRLHENVFFVMSGHHNNEDDHRGLLASIGDNGNTVYQLLSGDDYDGWLRILTFVPAEDKIYVKSYSPWQPEDPSQQYRQYPFTLPGYNTDQYHQYELHYDMR